MANKYLIHGATYCGDGTTSSEAASNGAAGAWNNINVLTGTAPAYGSVAAGDTVYIRSKTSGGADIAVTLSGAVNLGSSSATASNRIRWVLDSGSVWSGISGTLKITPGGSYQACSPRAYNSFISETPYNWIHAASSGYSGTLLSGGSGLHFCLYGICIDCTSAGNQTALDMGSYARVVVDECKIIGASANQSGSVLINQNGSGAHALVRNLAIDLSHTHTKIMNEAGQGGHVRYLGGELFGAGATTGTTLVGTNASSGILEFLGFQYPFLVNLTSSQTWSGSYDGSIRSMGVDGGVGSVTQERFGVMSSRTDGYFPYLNAKLPDSGLSGWSWWIYPTGATFSDPWQVNTAKYFTDTAAAVTLTMEMLISTAIESSIDTNNCWMCVSYVDDSTGSVKTVSSKAIVAGTSLTASTESWSATTYGAVNFYKRKIAVTTPTSVKKDTLIMVSLFGSVAATAASHLFFVDPDPVLS